MEQYMSKSALVAEIERRIKEHHSGYLVCLKDMLSFINTLEVKEVNLNEEIEKCLKRYNMLAVGKKDFTDIAKHFFELGIAVSNKAQKGDIV